MFLAIFFFLFVLSLGRREVHDVLLFFMTWFAKSAMLR